MNIKINVDLIYHILYYFTDQSVRNYTPDSRFQHLIDITKRDICKKIMIKGLINTKSYINVTLTNSECFVFYELIRLIDIKEVPILASFINTYMTKYDQLEAITFRSRPQN